MEMMLIFFRDLLGSLSRSPKEGRGEVLFFVGIYCQIPVYNLKFLCYDVGGGNWSFIRTTENCEYST